MAESPKPRRELILVCGLPASGKSHYTNQRYDPAHYTILSLDRTFAEMRADYPDVSDDEMAKNHWTEATQRLEASFEEAIARGDHIVYEATNLFPNVRMPRIKKAKASADFDYEAVAVMVHAPEAEEHARRLIGRGFREPGRFGTVEKIDRYLTELIPPSQAEGFDRIEEVGTAPTQALFADYAQAAQDRRPLTDKLRDWEYEQGVASDKGLGKS